MTKLNRTNRLDFDSSLTSGAHVGIVRIARGGLEAICFFFRKPFANVRNRNTKTAGHGRSNFLFARSKRAIAHGSTATAFNRSPRNCTVAQTLAVPGYVFIREICENCEIIRKQIRHRSSFAARPTPCVLRALGIVRAQTRATRKLWRRELLEFVRRVHRCSGVPQVVENEPSEINADETRRVCVGNKRRT